MQTSTSSSCSKVKNCDTCEYQICMKCQINRVLPDCSCAIGFLEQSGSCVKCPDNCQVCTDSSTCTACNQQYSLQNGQCFCPTTKIGQFCTDPNNLTYSVFAGADFQSIELVFSDLIRINGINENAQFASSINNCILLDSTSITFYDLGSSVNIPNKGCYIKQNHQNVFVIVVGQLQGQQQLIVPTINLSQILRYSYGSTQTVLTATTNQSQILIQLNYMIKSCYFKYQSLVVDNTNPGTLNVPFIFTQNNIQNVSCLTVSQSQGVSTTPYCVSKQSLNLDISTLSVGQNVVVQASCQNMFLITTSDQISITVSTATDQITNQLTLKLISNIYQLNQQVTAVFSIFHQQNIFSDLTVQVSSIPQIFTTQSQQLTSNSYTLNIPPNTYNAEGFVIIKVQASNADNSLISTQYLSFTYKSAFWVSISQANQITYPYTNLNYTAQVLDIAQKVTNQSNFQVKWLCFDSQKQLCQQNGAPLTLNSGFMLNVQNFYLPINSLYMFYAYVYRVQDYSAQQFTINQINGPYANLTYSISSTQSNNPNLISSQDFVNANMNYFINSTFQSLNISYVVRMTNSTNTLKQIQSSSSTIFLCIQDYFPILQFSTNNPTFINFAFSVHDYSFGQESIVNAKPLQLQIRTPPSGCIISFGTTNQIIGFKDVAQISINNCQTDASNGPYTYQYFFYQNASQLQQEIVNPLVVQRQELSLKQSGTEITTLLPPGNLQIMVILQGQYSVSANFTQTILVQDNNFTSSYYEVFIQKQYNQSQQYQQQQNYQSEIFNYQNIALAIQQYEQKNSSYFPSQSINTLKNDIIQRLSDTTWQNLNQEAFLLSQKIVSKITQSKIQVSIQSSQNLLAQNEQTLNSLVQEISQQVWSNLSIFSRFYYKQILIKIIQNFMLNVNNINSWTPSDCQNIIQQISNALGGISQVMMINEPQLTFNTTSSQLQAEKLDYATLMQKYFNITFISNASASQLSLNYHVHIQTYPTDSKLYRNELSDINSQYQQNTTSQEILSLLQKTYPVKIPQIMTDQKISRARFLTLQQGSINSPIIIQFGQISDQEKLKCIQRSTSGKWVSNSCKATVQIINNQRQISCSCNQPDITSLIADIDQLFDNQNVQDIFSESGIERLIHLNGWYKYAPIWTIIGLNIFLITILIIGCRLDKRDKQTLQKNIFLHNKFGLVGSDRNSFISEKNVNNQSQFMKVKNSSNLGSPLSQGTPKNQFVKTLSKENENNQLNNKKSLFAQIKVENNQNTSNNENKDGIDFVKDGQQIKQQQQLITNNSAQPQIVNIENIKIESFDQVQILNTCNIQHTLETQQNEHEALNNNKDNIITQIIKNIPQQRESETSIPNENQSQKDEIFNRDYFEMKNKKLNQNNLLIKNDANISGIFTNEFNTPSPTHKNQHEIVFVEAFQLEDSKEKEQTDCNQSTNDKNEQKIEEYKKSEKNITKKQRNFSEQLLIQPQQQNNINLSIQKDEMQKSKLSDCSPNSLKSTQNEQQIQICNSLIQPAQLGNKSEEMSITKNYDKDLKEQQEKIKLQQAKEKLQEYLQTETQIKGTLVFHLFFQTFIVFDEKHSRAIKFVIYYNKMVWLLALNSIFGVNLSIAQIIILSVSSTITLLIVTALITALLSKKKLKVIGLIISSLFLLFCYYSILVVISGQDSYQANIWIGSYFLTLFINEYLIGLPICFVMYQVNKKVLNKVESPIILQILGTGLLIEAFKN
ncbi:hypothetical protein ABPG73_019351 [Tetrahymena malaccensis]